MYEPPHWTRPPRNPLAKREVPAGEEQSGQPASAKPEQPSLAELVRQLDTVKDGLRMMAEQVAGLTARVDAMEARNQLGKTARELTYDTEHLRERYRKHDAAQQQHWPERPAGRDGCGQAGAGGRITGTGDGASDFRPFPDAYLAMAERAITGLKRADGAGDGTSSFKPREG